MAGTWGPGTTIGDFRIVDELGRGGMGVVYRAEQLSLGRQVALKVISPVYGQDPEFRARFHREATLQASMDSPHVVSVHDHGEVQGTLYLATQLVTGGDLRDRLTSRGPLGAVDALTLCDQVARALAVAHRAGVVHRDVKPNNILLRPGAEIHAYLADFGVAQAHDSELTSTGSVIGTYRYLAPERCFGGPATPATDQYALGCVLLACLTGHAPYAGSDLEIAQQHSQAPVPQLPPHHPAAAAVNPLLQRMLAKDPRHRFANLDESSAALRRALGEIQVGSQPYAGDGTVLRSHDLGASPAGSPGYVDAGATVYRPPAAPPSPLPPTAVQPPPRRRWIVPATIAAVVVLLAGGIVVSAVALSRADEPAAAGAATAPGSSSTAPGEASTSASPPTASAPASPEVSPSPLPNLESRAIFENPPCDGRFIVMIRTAGAPKDYGQKLEDAVGFVTQRDQAKYMQAGLSCSALAATGQFGDPVYNVFLGPFDSNVEACQARARLVGEGSPSAWVRQLEVGSPKRDLCGCQENLQAYPTVSRPGPTADDLDTRRKVSEAQYAMLAKGGGGSLERLAGYFDSTVAERVTRWQARNGLPETGALDPDTWRSVIRSYCDVPTNPPGVG